MNPIDTTIKCVDKHYYINTLDVTTTTTSVKVHKWLHQLVVYNDAQRSHCDGYGKVIQSKIVMHLLLRRS
jgi:hypothetical protein